MRTKHDLDFYENEIFEFINECTHDGELDIKEFDNKITGLQAAALVDGIEKPVFQKMVQVGLKKETVKLAS